MLLRLLCLAALLALPTPGAAGLRAIVVAGDRTDDGFALTGLAAPVGRTARDVVLSGGTFALVRRIGDAVAVPVKTGDPLPAPLAGVFGSLGDHALLPDGTVLFEALLERSSASRGLFRLADDAIEVVEVGGPLIRDLAANARGDFVFKERDSVVFQESGGPRHVVLSPGDPILGGRLPNVDALAVGNDGHVAFVNDRRRSLQGVALWDQAQGARVLVSVGALGIERFDSVAVSPTGAVAFTGQSQGTSNVYGHSGEPGTPPVLVAQNVARRFVAFDGAGRLTFARLLDDGSYDVLRTEAGLEERIATTGPGTSALRVANDGSLVWVSAGVASRLAMGATTPVTVFVGSDVGEGFGFAAPQVNLGGTAIALATRTSVLRDRGRRPKVVAHEDADVRGFGRLRELFSWRPMGHDVLMVGRDAIGRDVLALARGRKLTSIVHAGVPAPAGGAIVLADNGLDRVVPVGRELVVPVMIDDGELRFDFVRAGVGGGPVRPLIAAATPSAPTQLYEVTAAGKKRLLIEGVDADAVGLFLSDRRGVAALARVGDAAPGGGTFSWFEGAEAVGDRVLSVAYFVEDGVQQQGVYLWTRHRGAFEGRRLADTGGGVTRADTWPLPDGATVDGFHLAEGVRPATVVVVRVVTSRGREWRVFTLTGNSLSPLVAPGIRLESGATLGSISDVYALAGGVVAVAGTLAPDGRFGLLAVRGGRVRELVATGDTTPLGGTLSNLEDVEPTEDGRAITFLGEIDGGEVSHAVFSVDTTPDR